MYIEAKAAFSPFASSTIIYNGLNITPFYTAKLRPTFYYRFNKNIVSIDFSRVNLGNRHKITTDYLAKKKYYYTGISTSFFRVPFQLSCKYGRSIFKNTNNQLEVYLGVNNYLVNSKFEMITSSDGYFVDPTNDTIFVNQTSSTKKLNSYTLSTNISLVYKQRLSKLFSLNFMLEFNKAYAPIYLVTSTLQIDNRNYIYYNYLKDTYLSFSIGLEFNKKRKHEEIIVPL